MRKALGFGGVVAAAAAVGTGIGRLVEPVTASMGAHPDGERLERMRASAQWGGQTFRNRRPTSSLPSAESGALQRMRDNWSRRKPAGPIPLVTTTSEPATAGPVVTWFGHASALLTLDGARILLDPVWSDRCSPSQHVGPKRLHPTPVSLADLGAIDLVVISHDHYDHLDMDTVVDLAGHTDATFVVPLGIGAHLESWGVPSERFVELDWEQSHTAAGITLTCVESQHFSGRGFTRDETLWASWVIAGPSGRVFFSGDTGYFDGYADLGERHGPFDVALMAIGAYDPAWRSIHLDPEEAVQATVELGRPLLLPIHWGTFVLAPHPWEEPVERLLRAAEVADVRVVVPRPGESVEAAAPVAVDPWWRGVAAPAPALVG